MKLSTRGRYGTRALLDLALHSDESPVPLKDIARRQQISLPSLEHLVTPLVVGEIIRSVGSCAMCDIWDEIRKAICGVLEGTTLQELVERQRQKEASRNGETLGSEGAVRAEQPKDT
jgi:DNA-binding IscR family transcriptional regulator